MKTLPEIRALVAQHGGTEYQGEVLITVSNLGKLLDAQLEAQEGPDYEDGPDEDGFRGPRPWNNYAAPEQAQPPKPCAECKGTGEVETGIGMMVCQVCHELR